MSEKEIQEGNRLIAEFDYLPKLTDTLWINPVLASSTDHLAYHESWGWLMPVVEKICRCRYPDYYGSRGKTEDDGEFDDCAYIRTFGMRDKDGNYMVRFNASQLFISTTLIEATYMAVIDFIKWYNSLNPQQ